MTNGGSWIFSRGAAPVLAAGGRRRFLASAGYSAAAIACGSGGDRRDGTGPSAPSPVYARFTDRLDDLLTGQPIASGRITVPGYPAIEVRDGRYSVSDADRLELGSRHAGVLVEAPGCVSRKTGIVVTADGFRVELGYRTVPLDVVGDVALYERWFASRIGRILERWDPPLYRGALLFDRQLFSYGGTKPVLSATDYDVEPSLVSAALHTASTAIAGLTGGALHDGVACASEVPRSEWPDPGDLRGWLVYFTLAGYFEWQTATILSASYLDGFGIIHGSAVSLPPGRITSPAEILAATRDAVGRYLPGTVAASPASLGESFGVIQYNRKIGQRWLDVPDYQD